MTAPEKTKGHPLAPTRQLCSTCVVKAWGKITLELIRKACECCG